MIDSLLNGRFRLEEKIGSGGMSTVYRAFDETLERSVAIKLMHREFSEDAQQLERFRREARSVARLSHQHVVTVIDAGEDDGHPFIVFELVDGETLKDRIRRVGRLPVVEAVAYAIEIGRALMAAHAERLVHRDVKPQNVLIDPEGRAKVTDFGIARSLEAEGLTATGRVLGTTDYVSPEQALGEDVNEASDVYSLGIVLFEMLTGDVPFKADSQVAVAMKHVREPIPDVQHRRPEVSAALAAVVERATTKERDHRYATAEEMVRDLEAALTVEAARAGEATGETTAVLKALGHETTDSLPLRLRSPHRALVATLIAAALAAVVVVILIGRTERGSEGAAPAPPGARQLEEIRLRAARDYDPIGGDGEHARAAGNAIDGQIGTIWDTESYEAGLGKAGVGLYVKTADPAAAQQLDLVSPQPGWKAEIYAANEVPESIEGWGEVLASKERVREEESFDLDTASQPYRYYLIWITGLAEDAEQAAISEITLREASQ